MDHENTDLDISTAVTLDGVEHTLAACKGNGSCTYQVQQLLKRLEFRDTDCAPKPRRTLVFDGDEHSPLSKAIAEYRLRGGVGDLPDNLILEMICMFWNDYAGDKFIGIDVEGLNAFLAK